MSPAGNVRAVSAMRAGAWGLFLLMAGCAAAGTDGTATDQVTGSGGGAAAPVAAPLPPAEPLRAGFTLKGRVQQGGLVVGRAPTGATAVHFNDTAVPLAPDGYFLIGFDRDAPPQATLAATIPGRPEMRRALTVAPGEWRIEHVDTRYTGGAASTAEFQRRRAGELAQINAARRTESASDGWRQTFIWPVKGRLSGYFGSQRVYQGKPGSYHSGTDIAVPAGTPFVAPANGIVVIAAETPFTLEGRLLIVNHGNGLSSAFLHCSRLDVKAGDTVTQGQQLGLVGATGRASGPHLHWAMRWGSARLDSSLVAGTM